jgi:hypothetical protein
MSVTAVLALVVLGCGSKDPGEDTPVDCTQKTFYADVDGDGFGAPEGATTACEAPVGMVANGDDCDDANLSIHPGAPELCGGDDDDCDGLIDDEDDDLTGRPTWYADGDGDGVGDSTKPAIGCGQPKGYAAEGGD